MLSLYNFIFDHINKIKHNDLIADYYHRFGLYENINFNYRLFYNNIDSFFDDFDYNVYNNPYRHSYESLRLSETSERSMNSYNDYSDDYTDEEDYD